MLKFRLGLPSATLLSLLSFVACRPKRSVPKAPAQAVAAPSAQPASAARSANPLVIRFDDEPKAKSRPIQHLHRGINFGNGFDAPSLGAWGVVLSETHFDMAKGRGFDHIRLPARVNAYTEKTAPYSIDEAFLQKLDWALDQAERRGLAIILDLHHYEELMLAPKEHAERALAIWSQLSERYQNRPASVLFELLNEPNQALDPERLNALHARLIAEIRKKNPTRTLICDSYFWAAADRLRLLDLPPDENVVASFHMYQPILFTHQGASWMPPEYQTKGILFPGPGAPLEMSEGSKAVSWVLDWLRAYERLPVAENPSGVRAVQAEFDKVSAFMKASGRRVYLGEFGAIDIADETSRENYVRLVRREAERRGIPWAIWDDGGRNMAMNVRTQTWVGPIERALFQDQP